MVELIAVHKISIAAGQTYGIGDKETIAESALIIERGEPFSLPKEQADKLLKINAVKLPPESKPKGAKSAANKTPEVI